MTLPVATCKQLIDALSSNGKLVAELLDLSDVKIEGILRLTDGEIGQLYLSQAEIAGDLQIESVKIDDLFGLGLKVTGDLQLGRVTVEGQSVLSDVVVGGSFTGQHNVFSDVLKLVGCRVNGATRLHLLAGGLDLGSARLTGGGDIRFRGGNCNLRFADLSGSILISSTGSFSETENAAESDHGTATLPAILSLESANVAGLTLAAVDLRTCRFAGAHNLDRARIEDSCLLARTPNGWRWRSRGLRHPIRYSTRRVIYEEIEYRAIVRNDPGWRGLLSGEHDSLAIFRPGDPAAIASIYRALRKGREDARDEPGAADFYYGEMEMRRQRSKRLETVKRASAVERYIVGIYWLVSGYSLRAWRAFAALAMVILACSWVIGLRWPQSLPHSGTQPDHYISGVWMTLAAIFLRSVPASAPPGLSRVLLTVAVVGPILIALGLLAVRGRVKR